MKCTKKNVGRKFSAYEKNISFIVLNTRLNMLLCQISYNYQMFIIFRDKITILHPFLLLNIYILPWPDWFPQKLWRSWNKSKRKSQLWRLTLLIQTTKRRYLEKTQPESEFLKNMTSVANRLLGNETLHPVALWKATYHRDRIVREYSEFFCNPTQRNCSDRSKRKKERQNKPEEIKKMEEGTRSYC